MGRKERLFVDDIALHIGIKGINEELIFKDEEDYQFYRSLLEELSTQMRVAMHAYSLMPSEIHFLSTFADKDVLSRFMQSLSLKYVSYFNKKYQRSGTLWQGRYKSSLVEDRYILDVMYYINSLAGEEDRKSPFLQEHEVYKLLGKDSHDRSLVYAKRFSHKTLLDETRNFIETSLKKQTLTGSLAFYKKLENITGQTLLAKKRGRPKKDQNNTKGKKMFKKLVVLDKEKHKALKLSPLEDLKFAQDMNSIPVLVSEVAQVGEVFPVVFTTEETPALVALTSLGGQNLAINSEGKYITNYIPAYLRKYPFSLANNESDPEQKVVVIDEEASVFSKTKGKQLFTKEGEQSKILEGAMKFLTEYETQAQNTTAVVKAIVDSGILEPREISIGEGEEKKVLVNGFQVVNREKLNNLDDETLALWVRKGIISFIDAHLKSLSKIEVLFKLASQNQQQEQN